MTDFLVITNFKPKVSWVLGLFIYLCSNLKCGSITTDSTVVVVVAVVVVVGVVVVVAVVVVVVVVVSSG